MRTLALLLLVTTLPLGAAGRELAPRVIGPTPNGTSAPTIAFAGDRFLTTWVEHFGFTTSVQAAFSDRRGVRLSAESFTLDVPEVRNPLSMQLVGTGDGYALFWSGYDEPTHIARIDLQGRVVAVTRVDLPGYSKAEFAWNGTHFLAVVQVIGSASLEAAMFDRDGRLVRGRIAFAQDAFSFDLVVSDQRFIVVTAGSDGLVARTITAGSVDTTIVERPGQNGRHAPAWVAATAGPAGDVLVAWSGRASASTRSELRSAILRHDGTTGARLLETQTAVLIPLAVMYTGAQYVVAYTTYRENDLTSGILRVDAAGDMTGSPDEASLPVTYPPAAASNGQTLVLAYTTRGVPSRAATVAIDSAGTPRAPEIVAINESRQTQPVVASGGGDAVAAWTEIAGDRALVRTAHLDGQGHSTAVHDIASGYLGARGLAWSGTQYLAVYRHERQLLATRIAANGERIDEQPIVIDDALATTDLVEVPASTIWSGDRWLVVWGDGAHLRVASVSSAGVPAARRSLPLHAPLPETWERFFAAPSLAFDGNRVLVGSSVVDLPFCMMPACDGARAEAVGALLTSEGTVLDTVPLDFDERAEEERVQTAAASNGTRFLLLAGTRAFVLDAPGNDLRVVSTRELFDWPARTDVTWDGTNYVVALRYAGTDWYLALRRLDRSAKEVGAPRGTQTLAPVTESAPSAAPLFAGDTITGLQEGTARDGMRAVVYLERDLLPLPAPPSAPQNVRIRPLDTTYRFEITWDAPATGTPELYIVEALMNGRWTAVARVAGGDQRKAIFYTNELRVRAFNAGGPSSAGERGVAGTRRRSVR
ncbi:MAG TPA: hypothetical protein VF911_07620 [Thermoanaerobaculia bacterium]|jgi:hypothetical protein